MNALIFIQILAKEAGSLEAKNMAFSARQDVTSNTVYNSTDVSLSRFIGLSFLLGKFGLTVSIFTRSREGLKMKIHSKLFVTGLAHRVHSVRVNNGYGY